MSSKKLKQLHKTIDTIVKDREIQKARVDSNVMKEEMSQEELERFHRPMVEKLESIVDITKSEPTTLIPIEGPTHNLVNFIKEKNVPANGVFNKFEVPSPPLFQFASDLFS